MIAHTLLRFKVKPPPPIIITIRYGMKLCHHGAHKQACRHMHKPAESPFTDPNIPIYCMYLYLVATADWDMICAVINCRALGKWLKLSSKHSN